MRPIRDDPFDVGEERNKDGVSSKVPWQIVFKRGDFVSGKEAKCQYYIEGSMKQKSVGSSGLKGE